MTNFTPRSGEGGWGAARADLSWRVARVSGSPSALFALTTPASRLVRWCEPDRRALVLGSAQAPVEFDGPVVRRRSGGSGVVVGPGVLVWADVVIPAGDPLWADDIGVAPLWLGEVWARAIGGRASVHTGAMIRTPLSATWCFAGVGPGEVLIGGRKVVGISQRRTRAATLFQSAALLRWEPPVPSLAGAAMGLDTDAASVEAAFLQHMPLP